MNYIVFDMEWNQPFGSTKPIKEPIALKGEIIQIGAVKLNEDFERVDTFKASIRPQYYKLLNPKVAKVTGMRAADLNCGYLFPYALQLFRRFCGEEFVFMTWGCDDLIMLKDNMILHGLDTDWLKKCYNLQEIYDDQVSHEGIQVSLSKAAQVLGAQMLTAHDAMYDALSTVNVLQKLDMVNGLKNYQEHLNRWSQAYPVQDGDTQEFDDRDVAYNQTQVEQIICPLCNNTALCRRWAMQNANAAINIADCAQDHHTMVRIRYKRLRSGKWEAVRSLFEMNEGRAEFYQEKLEKYLQEKAEKEEYQKMRCEDGVWRF